MVWLLYMLLCTLTCQKFVQDHLIVQMADFSEINKRVGLNNAVQEGFFLIYVGENQVLKEKMSKINKRVVANKVVQVFFFQKNNKICCMNFRQVRVGKGKI